jgi:hypothetical protein
VSRFIMARKSARYTSSDGEENRSRCTSATERMLQVSRGSAHSSFVFPLMATRIRRYRFVDGIVSYVTAAEVELSARAITCTINREDRLYAGEENH